MREAVDSPVDSDSLETCFRVSLQEIGRSAAFAEMACASRWRSNPPSWSQLVITNSMHQLRKLLPCTQYSGWHARTTSGSTKFSGGTRVHKRMTWTNAQRDEHGDQYRRHNEG